MPPGERGATVMWLPQSPETLRGDYGYAVIHATSGTVAFRLGRRGRQSSAVELDRASGDL